MGKLNFHRPVDSLLKRDGYPVLSSYAPIAVDRSRYKGTMTEANIFVIYECQSELMRWNIQPTNITQTADQLRDTMLVTKPNLHICAGGQLTLEILSFEFCDDELSEKDIREIVVRTFAARQMDLYFRFEHARVGLKGNSLGETIADLLKYYGYEIPRLH